MTALLLRKFIAMAHPIERVTNSKISGKRDREAVLAEIRNLNRTAVKAIQDAVGELAF